jgi:hypothetical protein
MRKSLFVFIFIFSIIGAYSQTNILYEKGLSAEQNLNAIMNLAPYSTGGIGFDTRYQGIKGSPRLFDTLMPSFLKIKGKEYYIQLKTDIDIVGNSLLLIHPKTGKMLSLPSDIVSELIIENNGEKLIFNTSDGKKFEKKLKEQKFFQVLNVDPVMFIRMPVKTFTEADYKGAYSADRRYDEYETKYRYYISGSDNIFHQIQLNKKSLIKLFPDKKELISNLIESKGYNNSEEMVIAVLEKL